VQVDEFVHAHAVAANLVERVDQFGTCDGGRFGLLGGEVAAVDEHEFAGVKTDRPPPGRAHKLVLPDPNRMTADFTEIIDHDSAPFSVRSWVHPHTRINPNAVCGTVVVAWSLGHTWRLEVDHPENWHLSPTAWICVVATRFSSVGLFPGMRGWWMSVAGSG
jgi:hypothetical protein